ncbi:ORF67 protein [Operophtera brumata nucleopolyhedrovirus]|uniref:ORF67 protein n=1 Tax=Operophtera brumata nucleopolyhedrovirus TaxID=1046267 RepID=A0A2H4UZW8_9ABAC|nr:ORF67 protein [Operophtera brumata nucleopolyhedrovirus]AUA60298.1 ORF67 protein [Operophtera brumata nucleopolyhedrovirus]
MTLYFTLIFFILLGLVFEKNKGLSNLIFYILIFFVIFLLLMQVYYIKPESSPAIIDTDISKRIKKKRTLEDTLDAILNKNTSSTD